MRWINIPNCLFLWDGMFVDRNEEYGMENKTVNWILRFVRILIPVVTLILGTINGSYISVRLDPSSPAEAPAYLASPSNYFDFTAQTWIDWIPFICMLLCMAAVVVAIVCAVKETENNLVLLSNFFCFALVADAAILIFCSAATVMMWVIGGLLMAGLVITALQEMKMEDAAKQK